MTTKELAGIAHELEFWMRFTKEKRFLEGWVSNTPTPELSQYARMVISQLLPDNGAVLDVGSGVVSILNGFIKKENLVAADPLGDLYRLIFDYKRFGLTPPVAVPAEELSFAKFDLVHCSNALDHTQNPPLAIDKMWDAVKVGGAMMIQGFENEGLHENYKGFHQWNISMEGSTLVIKSDVDTSHLTIEGEPTLCRNINPTNTTRNWYVWTAIKKEAAEF